MYPLPAPGGDVVSSRAGYGTHASSFEGVGGGVGAAAIVHVPPLPSASNLREDLWLASRRRRRQYGRLAMPQKRRRGEKGDACLGPLNNLAGDHDGRVRDKKTFLPSLLVLWENKRENGRLFISTGQDGLGKSRPHLANVYIASSSPLPLGSERSRVNK